MLLLLRGSATATLAAGTASVSGTTATTATVAWADATGGSSPYAYLVQYRVTGSGTWLDGPGPVSSPAVVTGMLPKTAYDFRVLVTDILSATATSNTATGTTGAAVYPNRNRRLSRGR